MNAFEAVEYTGFAFLAVFLVWAMLYVLRKTVPAILDRQHADALALREQRRLELAEIVSELERGREVLIQIREELFVLTDLVRKRQP